MRVAVSFSEKELLLQIAEGNQLAFKKLYDLHADAIYGVAFAYVKSAEFSEEIVQDVFVTIWLNRSRIGMIDNFSDYVFIIARNKIISQLRKKISEKKYLEQLKFFFRENTITPEQELIFKEANELIENTIALLPAQQRLVYNLCRQKGLKLEEVATQLDLSRNTVRNHLGKAMQFLKASLKNNSAGVVLLLSLLFIEM